MALKKHSISISLCMIVKNEEEVLGNCLSSVKNIVDEIVIIDTGSNDRTKKIAKKFTDCVFDFKWVNDFSKARNFAFSKAKCDYILWLDADDIITPENEQKLLELKRTLSTDVDAVSMSYHLSFNGAGQPIFSSRRNRLVKRERQFKWHGYVHEYLEVYGNIIQSDAAIHHKKLKASSDRNLKIYEEALQSGKELSPRDKYYYANECKDHQLFEKALYWYEQFLQEGKGWSEDNIEACGKMADCYLAEENWDEAIRCCLKSFNYNAPRGENCCRLGFAYLQLIDLPRAISWYKIATVVEIPEGKSPFINRACYTWLPHLQLCVCYSQSGDNVTAKKHNDLAAEFAPDNPQIQYNQKYFDKII